MEFDFNQAQRALQELVKGPYTLDDLLDLARNVNIDASGQVTVLYSGRVDGVSAADVAASMASDPGIRVIDKTAAAKFLASDEFMAAVGNLKGIPLQDMQNKAFTSADKTFLTDWMYHGTDGPWAQTSKRFVEATVGDVRILSVSPRDTSVLYSTELPTLLERLKTTDAVTSVDGVSRLDILKIGASYSTNWLENMRNALLGNAMTQSQLTKPKVGAYSDYVSLTPNQLSQAYSNATAQDLSELQSASGRFPVGRAATRVICRLGLVGGVVGTVLMSAQAAAAELSGDREGAKEIVGEWAADLVGSYAGEVIGAGLGTLALTAMAAVGVTVGAPLAGALVIGASMLGGTFGSDAAAEVFRLTKDSDNDGKIDLMNRIMNAMYGATYTISDPLPVDLDGDHLTLTTGFGRADLVANAKDSIAWRYALRELNPFVIPDISYDKHNQDGSLDLYDPETGKGQMTERYLEDRAAMLTWKIRYDLGMQDDNDDFFTGKKPYNEEWDTNSVDGNWDFVDLSQRLPGGAPLTLAIDGRGISLADHQVVFGTKGDDTIAGGDADDHLYGMAGNDQIQGGDGNDHLEGGLGNDRLEGGEGSDVIYGVDGDDNIRGDKGDDYLFGGAGFDTYVIHSGDGMDVIHDADGQGIVLIDGDDLDDADQVKDNLWISKDKKFRYMLVSEADGTTTLQATKLSVASDGQMTLVKILDFTSGQFGIDLGPLPEAPQPPQGDILGDVLVLTDPVTYDAYGNVIGTPSVNPRADMLIGGSTVDVIYGGYGNDVLYGKDGNDRLFGEDGSDLLAGGLGEDEVVGGSGNDIMYGDSTHSTVDLKAGTQVAQPSDTPPMGGIFVDSGIGWIRYQVNYDNLPPVSNANPDAVTTVLHQLNPTRFGTSNYTFYQELAHYGQGQGSDDVLDGGMGDDTLYGEAGNDTLIGGWGADKLHGGSGNDYLEGGTEDDLLMGDGLVYAAFLYASYDLMGQYRSTPLLEKYEDEFGDDTLLGGEGNDYLFGMAGADMLYGGAGNDYLVGDFYEVVNIPMLRLSEDGQTWVQDTSSYFQQAVQYHGDDLLDGGDGDDYLVGLAGSDRLFGGAGKDILVADGNPDEVQGRYGDDYLDGGADNDFLQGSGGDDELYGGSGDDELWGDEYAGTDGQPVTGWGGAPVIVGGSTQLLDITRHGRDYLSGGDGNDTLTGGGGSDTLDGGRGDDLMFGDGIGVTGQYEGDDTLYGREGNDQLQGNGGNDELYGGDGLDKLYGQDGSDILQGEAGDDYLEGGKGDDTLDGGDGVDTLWGNEDNDTLSGGAGNDLITGGAGNDTITGGTGRDYQDGGDGNDTYVLRAGDGEIIDNTYEMIVDSSGVDTLRFEGVDLASIVIYKGASNGDLAIQYGGNDGVYIKGGLAGAIEMVEFAGGATMSFADFLVDRMVDPLSLTASSGGTALAGGKAGDSLTTKTGNTVTGGTGNDVIYVYGSNNTIVMREGDGVDTVNVYEMPTVANRVSFGPGILPSDVQLFPTSSSYSSFKLNIRVNGDSGNALVFTGFNADNPMSFKSILGFFDFINPDGTVCTLTYEQMLANGFSYPFTEGADSVTGSGFDEKLDGLGGNDSISAGGGNDILIGGAGNDSLAGGAGNDILIGGVGDDYLSGGSGIDSYVFSKGDGVDKIDSFNDPGDKVLLAYDASQTSFRVRGDDLIMTFQDSADQVTAQFYFYNDGTGPSAGLDIVTADGMHLDYAAVRARVLQATAGDDFIIGLGGSDTIAGLAGDDTLAGGAGNDTIDGGAGNDILALDAGDDTYVFGVGSGHDRVQAVNYVPTYDGVGNDTILMSGLTASQVIATRISSYQMAIKILGSDDWIEFSPSNPGFSTLKVRFADGTIWTSADLLAKAPLSQGDDVLTLMDTDDLLNMLGGNDTVYANGGQDTIWGGAGNDTLYGGGGNDSLYGDDGSDKLSGGDGDDYLDGGAGIDSLEGGAGNDVLYAYTADGAKDTLTGGAGNDVYFISESTDVVVEADGGGYDTIHYVSKGGSYTIPLGIERVSYNAYGAPIKITGNAQDNFFDVEYSSTNDTLIGGAGNDTYYGVSSGDVVTESKTGGIDTVYFKGAAYTTSYSLAGTNIENAIVMAPYGNIFNVEAWSVSGTSANNYLSIEGGWALKAYGYDGNDTIVGCFNYTSYYGIYDYLDGGNGDDVLNGRGGAGDQLIGGAGNDTYYVYSTETLVEGANAGTDTVIAYRDYTLMTNFENLTLAEEEGRALNGTGNAVANKIIGNSYDNVLDGGDGADNLIGGGGNDTLIGGLGIDTMAGGIGDDSYVVDNASDVIQELLGEGNDSVQSSVTYTLAANVDNLTLTGTAAINGTGNTLANRLRGNAGANTLTGLAGNDTYLFGRGGGADTIVDSDSTAGNQDVLQLDAGVALDQLWFKHVGTALEISIIGTTDKVTVSNWYGGTANHVEKIQLADGHYLLDTKVEQLVSAMAGLTPPPAGQTTLSTAQHQQLDPVLAATWQSA